MLDRFGRSLLGGKEERRMGGKEIHFGRVVRLSLGD